MAAAPAVAAAALQQALLDIGANATMAAGAVGALKGQMAALQPLPAQVAALQAQVAAFHSLAARAWNVTCGDGFSRHYEPVPYAAGAAAPPGVQPVRAMTELLALSEVQLSAWCAHYGVQPAHSLSDLRGQFATQLGIVLLQEAA